MLRWERAILLIRYLCRRVKTLPVTLFPHQKGTTYRKQKNVCPFVPDPDKDADRRDTIRDRSDVFSWCYDGSIRPCTVRVKRKKFRSKRRITRMIPIFFGLRIKEGRGLQEDPVLPRSDCPNTLPRQTEIRLRG